MFLLAGQCEPTPTVQQKRLKLLYYTDSDDGSHHLTNTKIAAALVKKRHDVTFLLSDSCTKWRNASGADMFRFAVHRSLYTAEERERNARGMSRHALRGKLRGAVNAMKFLLRLRYSAEYQGHRELFNFLWSECDSLLGDNATIHSLREESFDLLIGDDLSDCQRLLAEMLGIKFVLVSGTGITPSK
ncbi:UDP-glucuronosyltransferase 1-6-like [Patiria miniata]|uniref:Uncharacterized protein n=1 Tax=Patiria miniata TaxID=46514 RepID=A0A914AME2_PATMI|nr:UDP-glucuronosyltransferase 1-6-like [Patiria miniata]